MKQRLCHKIKKIWIQDLDLDTEPAFGYEYGSGSGSRIRTQKRIWYSDPDLQDTQGLPTFPGRGYYRGGANGWSDPFFLEPKWPPMDTHDSWLFCWPRKYPYTSALPLGRCSSRGCLISKMTLNRDFMSGRGSYHILCVFAYN